MQLELLTAFTAISVAFGIGFLLGYGVRARLSWRRHRLASERRQQEADAAADLHEGGFRLERAVAHDEMRADAPSLIAREVEALREVGAATGRLEKHKANGRREARPFLARNS